MPGPMPTEHSNEHQTAGAPPLTSNRHESAGDAETALTGEPRWRCYVFGTLITMACTAVSAVMSAWFSPTNLAMVYLLGVVLAATRIGRCASAVTAALGVLALDFFFIPPVYSFAISDTQYLLTAIVLLAVGLLINSLAAGLRRQALLATHRERRTAALYAMTRELAVASSLNDIVASARAHLAKVFDAEGEILLKRLDGTLGPISVAGGTPPSDSIDISIAEWVFGQNTPAGFATGTLPAVAAIYLPLNGTHGIAGVLAVCLRNRRRLLIPEQRHLLETFANQIAVAVERDQLWRQARDSALAVQEERLRSSLLSSISHDLRTPLAAMVGSASSLLHGANHGIAAPQRQLIETINDEAQRMTRVVNNILDMTRLESGPVRLALQWYPLEEIVGAVLGRLKGQLANHVVSVDLPRTPPALQVDGVLFEKVLINLLENSAKYTPPGSRIGISASLRDGEIQMQVWDDGPGIPRGSEHLLFDKFYRGQAEGVISGAGLGLAICRGIVEAHHGRITAQTRAGGGALFSLVLPLAEEPDTRSEGLGE